MRAVLLLTSSIAIVGSNSLVLSPISPTIAADFVGISASDVMLAAATYGLATAISALFLAPFADKVGFSRALVISLSIITLALTVSASASSLVWLCIGQLLAGLGAGVALPTTYSLAVSVAPKGKESETLGWVLTGWTLSMVAGVSVSAVIADAIDWRFVFVLLAGLSFVLVLAMLFLSTLPNVQNTAVSASAFDALKVKGIIPSLLVCASYMMAFYGLYSFLGGHFQLDLGMSTSFAGLAPLAYGVGFGMAVPLDKFIDRFGTAKSASWVFASLTGVYLLIFVASQSAWGIVACCLLWGLVNHLGLNLIVLRLTSLNPSRRSAIMGLYSAVTYLSVFVGTSVFKPVFEVYGFAACALVAASCIVPSVVNARRNSPKPSIAV